MSYIGKNPKADSIKLTGTATAASGTDEGQLYYNTGTGSISKGLKVFKNSNFVAIDKQLGDADTFHLLKAADIATSEWSSAVSSTGVVGHQNAVPFETSTGSIAGAFSNDSTGDALMTDESADLVFNYKSSGTSDDAQEFFGIPLSIPKAFRGGNIVLSFVYRTENDGASATADSQFLVGVLDVTTGNGVQTTSTATALVSAGSNVAVASSTNMAAGQRIWLESGGESAVGDPDATVTDTFIVSVVDSTNITLAADYTPSTAAGSIVTSGWLTDQVNGLLPAADSDTDKQGKNFSLQFKTEDDTSDLILWFQNKNTSSTDSFELFVDNILLSANKFLQANAQLKPESYIAGKASGFWLSSTGTAWSTGATRRWDTSKLVVGPDTPAIANSRYLEFTTDTVSTETATVIKAKKKVRLTATFGNDAGDDYGVFIYLNDTTTAIGAVQQRAAGDVSVSCNVDVVLDVGDFISARAPGPTYDSGWTTIVATPIDSPVVILESQDEIFTDWVSFTPVTGITGGTKSLEQGYWKRVGSDMEVKIAVAWSTIFTGGTGTFDLPSGYSIDTAKIPTPLNSEETDLGVVTFWDNSAAQPVYGKVGYSDTDTVKVIYEKQGSTSYSARIANTGTASITSQTGTAAIASVSRTGTGLVVVTFTAGFFTVAPAVTAQAVSTGAGYATNIGIPTTTSVLVRVYDTNDYSGYDEDFDITINRQTGDWDRNLFVGGDDNVGTALPFTFANDDAIYLTFKVPIAGWNANFNPLLSMPLVDFGTFENTYSARISSTGVITSQVGGFLASADLDSTGSYDMVYTSGFFPVKPAVVVTVEAPSEGPHRFANTFSETTSGFSILIANDAGSEDDADFAITISRQGSDYRQPPQATVAVIKPAVAIIKDVKAYNADAGGAASGSWFTRDLNTLEGESWFVTLDTNKFTLESGQYKINWITPFYNTGYSQSTLYDETNTAYVVSGQGMSTYINNTGGVAVPLGGNTVITITSSTEFSIQSRVGDTKGTDGRGNQQNTDSTRNSIYTQIVIEKLK